jgi:hypothetical protein
MKKGAYSEYVEEFSINRISLLKVISNPLDFKKLP